MLAFPTRASGPSRREAANGCELSCQLSTSSVHNVLRRPARCHGQSEILVLFQGSSEVLGASGAPRSREQLSYVGDGRHCQNRHDARHNTCRVHY